MKLRNLLFLYAQRVRTHPLQELIALAGIAVGVALVFAVQVANTSVSASVERLVRGTTGAADLQLVARSPSGFDAAVVDDVARLPDVARVAPLVELRVRLRSGERTASAVLLGGDRHLRAMGGRLSRQFASPSLEQLHALALPAPLAKALGVDVGGRVSVAVGVRTRQAPVAIVLGDEQIGSLEQSPIALAPLAYASELGGIHGRITRVLVDARPGRLEQARAELAEIADGRLTVAEGDADVRRLKQAAAPNDQSTALFAAISALVGLLFAFNAMLLTVPERRRFIADLRLEGLGDLAVVRLVLFDALVLGIVASIVGLLLGDALSRGVFHATPGYLSFAFPVGDQRIVETRSVAIAFCGGIAATVLAAMRPLSDLFSRRPLDDVYREDGEREDDAFVSGRAMSVGGVALVASAGALMALAPNAMLGGFVLLVGGMLLLIPGLLTAIVRAIDRVSQHTRSAVVIVSVGELRTATTRSIALAATGALAVLGSVAIEGAHFDLQRGLDRDARAFNATADLWIAPADPQNELATVPFALAPARVDAIARLAGVQAVRRYRGAFLDVGDRRTWVVAPPRSNPTPILGSQVVEGDLAQATQRLRSRGWVALSDALAEQLDVGVGDTLTLPTPRPTRLRLAAVLTNLGWSAGAIVLNASDFRRAWGSADVSALQVLLAPGTNRTETVRAIRRTLGPTTMRTLGIETSAQREARFRMSTRQGLNRLTQIATLMLVAAALALAAAMGGVVWNRRARLAALKLSGFSDGEVWRALVLENALVLGIGCSIGAIFGLCGQFMLTRLLADATDFPTSYVPAGWLALATFVGVTLVAVAIAALPGYLAARVSPAASIYED
ncbi:MAG TPA: FtsX-like permease family protein [Conexibacter sp.]|nr:FtsX-like permease family protein [Conexibacter sp.]